MKKLLSVVIAALSVFLVAADVDAAKRFGGGGNVGKQRSGVTQQQAAPKAPAQQQGQAAPAAPVQQPSGMSRWLGPLAGLAIGAGLASLFFHNGLGGALAGMLMAGLLVAAVLFALRYFMRGRSAPQQPLQYAGAGAAAPISTPVSLPGGAGSQSVAATLGGAAPTAAATWPAGFDAEAFTRQAKVNFVNMQAANDKRDLSTMRDFLTPEMYREIEANLRSEWGTPQKTEVVTLEGEVLDVTTENDFYTVSVRFSGLIREQNSEPEAFSEIWNLEKPVNGRSGWLIAGIQQS